MHPNLASGHAHARGYPLFEVCVPDADSLADAIASVT